MEWVYRVLGWFWNIVYVVITFFVNLVMVYPVINLLHFFMPNFLYQNPYIHFVLWHVYTALAYLELPQTEVNADFFMAISLMLIVGVWFGWIMPRVPGLKQLYSLFRGERPTTSAEDEKIQAALQYAEQKAGKSLGTWHFRISMENAYNAFTAGHQFIAFTEPLLRDFTVPEIAGIMAHEMGHAEHGDTQGIGVVYGFSLVGNFCISILNLVVWLLSCLTFIPILGILCMLTAWIFVIFVRLYCILRHIPTFICRFISRRQEALADSHALELNLGWELIWGLRRLQRVYGDVSWWKSLADDHPRLQTRIQDLRWRLPDEEPAQPILSDSTYRTR